jgi:hypothetical protein
MIKKMICVFIVLLIFNVNIIVLATAQTTKTTTTSKNATKGAYTVQIEWSKLIDKGKEDNAFSVRQTNDGGYIIAGKSTINGVKIYVIKTDENGNTTWDKTFDISDIITGDYKIKQIEQTKDDGYIIFGDNGNTICLIKLNQFGDVMWKNKYKGKSAYQGKLLLELPEGGYIITGITQVPKNNYDILLLKVDGYLGEEKWNQTIGGYDDDRPYYIVPTNDGGYMIIGYTKSYGSGDSEIWVVKTGKYGEKQMDLIMGKTREDKGYYIHQTDDGNFIIVGSKVTRIVDPPSVTDDGYIAKMYANGNLEWEKTYISSHMALVDTGNYIGLPNFNVKVTDEGLYDMMIIDPKGLMFYNIIFDANGTVISDKTFSDTYKSALKYNKSLVINDIRPTKDSGYIMVGGVTTVDKDVYLIKTKPKPAINNSTSIPTVKPTASPTPANNSAMNMFFGICLFMLVVGFVNKYRLNKK